MFTYLISDLMLSISAEDSTALWLAGLLPPRVLADLGRDSSLPTVLATSEDAILLPMMSAPWSEMLTLDIERGRGTRNLPD